MPVRLIDAVVEEIEHALAAEVLLVGERDHHRHLAATAVRHLRDLQVALVGEEGALVDVEIEINRIERDDRRQKGLVGGDEIAFGDQPAADAAAHRSANLSETQVQPPGPSRSLRSEKIARAVSRVFRRCSRSCSVMLPVRPSAAARS